MWLQRKKRKKKRKICIDELFSVLFPLEAWDLNDPLESHNAVSGLVAANVSRFA